MKQKLTRPDVASPLGSWLLVITAGVLVFLLNIDYTAVNQALVPLSDEIHAPLGDMQWLLSSYVLVWAAFVVPAGRLADMAGPKRGLVAGVVLFLAGSCLAGAGHTLGVLVAGRILQGLGAAVFSAPVYSLVFSSVPVRHQGLAIGILGAMAGLGLASGPSLAGWIVAVAGWRWIFWINLPLGALVIAGVAVLAKPSPVRWEDMRHVDPLSFVLLPAGLVFLMLSFHLSGLWSWSDLRVTGTAAAGLAAGTLFLWRDRTRVVRILPPALLHSRPYLCLLATIMVIAWTFSMTLVLMGLYLQNTLRMSNMDSAFVFLAFTLALGLLSPLGGRLADRCKPWWPVTGGLLLVGAGAAGMSCLDTTSGVAGVVCVLLVSGTGQGLCFSGINTLLFKTVDPGLMNTGSALFTMNMMTGNTLSVMLSTSFTIWMARTVMARWMVEGQAAVDSAFQAPVLDLLDLPHRTLKAVSITGVPQPDAVLQVLEEAFVYGFSRTTAFSALLSWLAAAGVFLCFRSFVPAQATPASGQPPAPVPI